MNRHYVSILLATAISITSSFAAQSTVPAASNPTSTSSTPALSPVIAAALKIDTKAEQAIIVDHATGKVLLEKNADQPMHPSSMTKIMTAYMVFERLKKNIVTPDTPITISKNAWKTGGSKMFIDVNSQVSINDLLHGIVIQSGNDACVAVAEGLSGTETVFAAEMTERARALGATNTNFVNASGLPDPNHFTTARDLMLIARHVIDDYPEYYALFGKHDYTYNNISQKNRNPLLNKNIGCDGLKTGFTEAGKYGLVASAKEVDQDGNEKRFDLVINGLPSDSSRSEEAVKLMTWAMRTFTSYPIYKQGQIIDQAPVWLGQEETIPLTVAKDCRITIPQVAKKDVKADIQYDAPLQAPIKKDQIVGKVIITAPTLDQPLEVQVIAAKDVDKASFFKRIKNSISYLIWGKTA
jgi:serine-type D-Ala-D-Ala carboxypeptidase (penicillin-binding protein 5/6)